MKMRWPYSRKRLSCHQVAELVQSYLDGETEDEVAAKISAHLDECRRCGLEAETYREIKAALARQAPGDVADAVDRLQEFGRSLVRGEGADI